jgi:hypothetical protein
MGLVCDTIHLCGFSFFVVVFHTHHCDITPQALDLWTTYYVRCAIHNVDDCHMSVILKDVMAEGDVWMVDIGCGYILPMPVCLSFPGWESPVYSHGFLRVKFVRYDPTLPPPADVWSPVAASAAPHLWRLHATTSSFDARECTLNRDDGFNHPFWRMSLTPRPLHDAGETQQVRAFTGYQKLRASIGIGATLSMVYIKADNREGRLDAHVLRDVAGELRGERVADADTLVELLMTYFETFGRDALTRAVAQLLLGNKV